MPSPQTESRPTLAARLGLFDATMLVMGGIVGSGIFINPYVVAGLVHTPALILGAWLAGGAIALAGAFIYAELADRMPKVGGQYAYIREAYHPLLGFLYGWICLLVIHAGGSAAVAVTFAKYFSVFSRRRGSGKIYCRGGGAGFYGGELPGRAGRRRRAERFYGAAHCGDCDDCGVRGAVGVLADRVAAGERGAYCMVSTAGSAAVVRSADGFRRDNDSGAIRLRRLSDFELRGCGNS